MQRLWNNTTRAQWTKRVIPQIAPWVEYKFKTTDFFLTQAVSKHGSFETYTFEIGKSADENYIHCMERDDPYHSLFICPRWNSQRLSLDLELVTTVTPDDDNSHGMKAKTAYVIRTKSK
ncbi:hypothetical protein JTB14_032650 [Gonioctena quinquepunctata]|nr:hypothetical protein JTB14_032650 [Gonioctena quinquepunctata]